QNDRELGRIILYRSEDLYEWEYLGPVDQSNGQMTEGYMWECPDLFELNGKHVFLFSPQGMEAEEEQYLNLFQNGYFVGDFDYDTYKLTRQQFKELDHGHDFYAPQTMETSDGRRILIGWMAMWEANMPEKEDGWSGALTLPRELYLKGDHLYMRPVEELKSLRIDEGKHEEYTLSEPIKLLQGKHQAEVNLKMLASDFILNLKNQQGDLLSLEFDSEFQKFKLHRYDIGDYRYAMIQTTETLDLQIYIDTSSIEIFINEGEAVFTERYYSETAPEVWLSSQQNIEVITSIYELEH
ncbi:GH32 C-terminal domain-containing protein, partial [Staphylococcus warneri]|uniref:glycoside hydrolase family 32 protein n=3 Tax=Staphylococcus TaxID=1279 RepID=UPI001F57B0DB